MSPFLEGIFTHLSQAGSAEIGALAVLALASLGLFWTLRGRETAQASSLSLWLCIVFGSLCSLTEGLLVWAGIGLSIGCAVINRKTRQDTPIDLPLSRPTGILLSVLSIVAIAFLLLYRLVPNFHMPLVWEGAVILNFLRELKDFRISEAFFSRLLWSEGLLSEGNRSLLYGFPTALLLNAHSSVLSLRIFSVIFFFLAAATCGLFCKRHTQTALAISAFTVFGLNELGLIFGRYGSSLAATLLSGVLALLCCAHTVAHPTAPRLVVAMVAMYVATLGYAPGRLVVLVLIAMTLQGLYCNTSISRLRKYSLCALLCVGIASVLLIQNHFHRSPNFASARGEQFFRMFSSGMWPEPLIPEGRAFLLEKRKPGLNDYLNLGSALLVTTTVPQLRQLILPFDRTANSRRQFMSDPLQLELYAPYLFPFLVLGFFSSRWHLSQWSVRTLVLWTTATLIPILFTNRVDSYRAVMALLPFSIWIAIGITETLSELRKTRFPNAVIALITCGAVLGLTAFLSNNLSRPNVTSSLTNLLLESLAPRFIDRSVIAVEPQDFRRQAETQLLLLRRTQRGLPVPSTIIPKSAYQSLSSSTDMDAARRERTISTMLKALESGAAVIVAPRTQMDSVIQRLLSHGYKTYPSPVSEQDVAIVLP